MVTEKHVASLSQCVSSVDGLLRQTPNRAGVYVKSPSEEGLNLSLPDDHFDQSDKEINCE